MTRRRSNCRQPAVVPIHGLAQRMALFLKAEWQHRRVAAERGGPRGEAVNRYHRLAGGNCYVDVSFHLIISDPTGQVPGQELPALIQDGYTSFKVFMTYEDLALSDREILK